jgi:SPP1 family predicted phage head-tail adaptor
MKAKASIGKLDRKITIQAMTRSQGTAYGEPLETYTTWLQPWAEVRPLTMREITEAKQTSTESLLHFQINWVSGMRMTHRILYEGLQYEIKSILDVGRRDRLNIIGSARRP